MDISFQSSNPKSSKSSDLFAVVFLALFALPFAAGGVGALAKGIKLMGSGNWIDGLGLMLMGFAFSAVGFGLLFGLFYAAKAKKRVDAIKAAHPREPWFWNEKWAGGSIVFSEKGSTVFACIVALFWNAISLTVIFNAVPKELHRGNQKVLFVLIFPAIGIVLLVWAAREIIRWKKFGDSTFKMLAMPGVIGGQLSGAIQTSVKIRPQDGFHLKLRCVNRVTTGSGKSSSTSETTLWDDEKTMLKELLGDDPRRSGIPVFFKIPPDCRESDDSNSRDQILWRLEARAKVPGVDYFARFDVPVFRVADAAVVNAPAADPTLAYQAPPEPYHLPAHSRIQVRETATGGKEFIFPALLNPGVALTVGLVLAVFLGATWLMVVTDKAPIIFPIVFGLADALMLLVLLNLIFKSSRITIDGSGVAIATRWLLIRRVKRFSPSDVMDITTRIGMTSGENVYYDVHILSRSGRDATAASGIKDRKEAVWLIAEMKNLLKLDKPALSPTISA